MSALATKLEAKSASDKTDDWPFWMIWDGSINVTIQALATVGLRVVGPPFLPREVAEELACICNELAKIDAETVQ